MESRDPGRRAARASSALIQVHELARLLAGPETARPVVLDVRFRMGSFTGFQDFEDSHVPGASYIDMNTELATVRRDGVGGRHPMPTVEAFVAAMRSAGVAMSRPVVAYDDWASLPASRVWWMLRHLGFLDVRVLDGGIAAWTAAGQLTESGPGAARVGDFSPSVPGVGRLLDATDAARYANTHLLLDARPADRFRGRTRRSTRLPVTSLEPSVLRPLPTSTRTHISCQPMSSHGASMNVARRRGKLLARIAVQVFRPPTWHSR